MFDAVKTKLGREESLKVCKIVQVYAGRVKYEERKWQFDISVAFDTTSARLILFYTSF